MALYSHALGTGIVSIEVYLDQSTGVVMEENGSPTPSAVFIGGLLESCRQLHFTTYLTQLASKLGGVSGLRQLIAAVSSNEAYFEHIVGNLGLAALCRIEENLERIQPFLEQIPLAAPPVMTKRFLDGAATCYLLGLDEQCIVMSRGAIEVLVEELDHSLEGEKLGAAINKLVPRKLSRTQADDMLEINRQAREILHRTPHRRRPSATDCISRLCRLLAQLSPSLT
jgi:hypothetical protein